jgi:alkylhydroperoxidase family enzyme
VSPPFPERELACLPGGRILALMSDFTIHTAASAPEPARPPLARLEQAIGFIPNLAGTIAGSPAAIAGFVGLQGALRGSALSPLEREVVGITVSRENASPYSMAAHSTFAARAGAEPGVVTALRDGEPLPDARLEALHAYTLAVLAARGHADDADTAALLDAGYTREHLLEVLAQVAYTTFANLVANVADTPLDAAFAPARWDAEALDRRVGVSAGQRDEAVTEARVAP